MRAFRATRRGYVARLDVAERLVLAHVVGDVVELLQAAGAEARDAGSDGVWPATGDVSTPTDPALRRLLPDASRDEPEVAAEFRRLTQGDLVGAKETRLLALADALLDDPGGKGGDLVVARDRARDTASALTDVRLVLGSRLGIENDEQSEALYDEVERGAVDDTDGDGDLQEPDSPDASRRFLGAVFVTAGWLQESLVSAMLDDLRAASH
jgi:hypothetical protein